MSWSVIVRVYPVRAQVAHTTITERGFHASRVPPTLSHNKTSQPGGLSAAGPGPMGNPSAPPLSLEGLTVVALTDCGCERESSGSDHLEHCSK